MIEPSIDGRNTKYQLTSFSITKADFLTEQNIREVVWTLLRGQKFKTMPPLQRFEGILYVMNVFLHINSFDISERVRRI